MDVKQILQLNYPLLGETLDNLQRREHKASFKAFEKKFANKTSISLEDLIKYGRLDHGPSLQLTEEAVRKVLVLTTERCRAITVDKIRSRMSRPLSLLPNFWWCARINFYDNGLVDYTFGQDGGPEMIEIRKNILAL